VWFLLGIHKTGKDGQTERESELHDAGW
jgi:hypothetical protein